MDLRMELEHFPKFKILIERQKRLHEESNMRFLFSSEQKQHLKQRNMRNAEVVPCSQLEV